LTAAFQVDAVEFFLVLLPSCGVLQSSVVICTQTLFSCSFGTECYFPVISHPTLVFGGKFGSALQLLAWILTALAAAAG
jgi:hypothetical protein